MLPKPVKKPKPTKADKEKRKEYLYSKGYQCEICGRTSKEFVHVHHRILQQHEYYEDEENYIAMDMWNCHSKLHASKSQFMREVKVAKCSEFADYTMEELYYYLLPEKKDI